MLTFADGEAAVRFRHSPSPTAANPLRRPLSRRPGARRCGRPLTPSTIPPLVRCPRPSRPSSSTSAWAG